MRKSSRNSRQIIASTPFTCPSDPLVRRGREAPTGQPPGGWRALEEGAPPPGHASEGGGPAAARSTLGSLEKGRVAPDVRCWPEILAFLGYATPAGARGLWRRLKRTTGSAGNQGLWRVVL